MFQNKGVYILPTQTLLRSLPDAYRAASFFQTHAQTDRLLFFLSVFGRQRSCGSFHHTALGDSRPSTVVYFLGFTVSKVVNSCIPAFNNPLFCESFLVLIIFLPFGFWTPDKLSPVVDSTPEKQENFPKLDCSVRLCRRSFQVPNLFFMACRSLKCLLPLRHFFSHSVLIDVSECDLW